MRKTGETPLSILESVRSVHAVLWGFCAVESLSLREGGQTELQRLQEPIFFPPHADIQSFIYFSKSVKNQLDSARKVYH